MTVRVRRNAGYTPRRLRGRTGEVVAEKAFSFGQPWLLLRFLDDGEEAWVRADRVEPVEEIVEAAGVGSSRPAGSGHGGNAVPPLRDTGTN